MGLSNQSIVSLRTVSGWRNATDRRLKALTHLCHCPDLNWAPCLWELRSRYNSCLIVTQSRVASSTLGYIWRVRARTGQGLGRGFNQVKCCGVHLSKQPFLLLFLLLELRPFSGKTQVASNVKGPGVFLPTCMFCPMADDQQLKVYITIYQLAIGQPWGNNPCPPTKLTSLILKVKTSWLQILIWVQSHSSASP